MRMFIGLGMLFLKMDLKEIVNKYTKIYVKGHLLVSYL